MRWGEAGGQMKLHLEVTYFAFYKLALQLFKHTETFPFDAL